MSSSTQIARRGVALAVAATLAVAGVGVATSGGAVDAITAKSKVKLKCPSKVASGKKVTCKVKGKLPKGPTGATGATGPAGAPGLSGYEIVSETFAGVSAENSGGQRGLSAVQTVDCPTGKRAIGGGANLGTNATQNGPQRQMILSASFPATGGDGWSAQLFNNATSGTAVSLDLEVYAVCATVD
jgi:hypothetical protein